MLLPGKGSGQGEFQPSPELFACHLMPLGLSISRHTYPVCLRAQASHFSRSVTVPSGGVQTCGLFIMYHRSADIEAATLFFPQSCQDVASGCLPQSVQNMKAE